MQNPANSAPCCSWEFRGMPHSVSSNLKLRPELRRELWRELRLLFLATSSRTSPPTSPPTSSGTSSGASSSPACPERSRRAEGSEVEGNRVSSLNGPARRLAALSRNLNFEPLDSVSRGIPGQCWTFPPSCPALGRRAGGSMPGQVSYWNDPAFPA